MATNRSGSSFTRHDWGSDSHPTHGTFNLIYPNRGNEAYSIDVVINREGNTEKVSSSCKESVCEFSIWLNNSLHSYKIPYYNGTTSKGDNIPFVKDENAYVSLELYKKLHKEDIFSNLNKDFQNL